MLRFTDAEIRHIVAMLVHTRAYPWGDEAMARELDDYNRTHARLEAKFATIDYRFVPGTSNASPKAN